MAKYYRIIKILCINNKVIYNLYRKNSLFFFVSLIVFCLLISKNKMIIKNKIYIDV